jgi:2-oxoglutarate dehydrogenase complex dehydrogenase (E1) component-like enzyme
MEPVVKIYEKQLIEDGVVTQEEWKEMKKSITDRLNDAYV